MEYFALNKNKNCFRLLFVPLFLFLVSCNPTRYVPAGETLLDKTSVVIDAEDIKRSDITPFIRQQPNKRIFGARFHLWLHNISNMEKEKFPHRWLRRIGEEPAILDVMATERSKSQIRSFLHSRGYFDARVDETIEIVGQHSKVWYNIEVSEPYRIRDLEYRINDTILRSLVYFDSVNCLINRGDPYNADLMMEEQKRLERFIRDFGFFTFSGDFVLFYADTTVGNRQVDVVYEVRNPQPSARNSFTEKHLQYNLRNIYIYPEFNPGEALRLGQFYFSGMDTTLYRGYHFIDDSGRPRIRYSRLTRSLFMQPGQVFNVTGSERSQRNLASLRAYRLINISYSEPVIAVNDSSDYDNFVDAIVQLTPFDQHSFTFRIEGTNSAGNLGAALNLIYQNRNLLRGAQHFNLRLKGAYERLPEEVTGFRSIQEFGAEAGLQLPDFLMPFMNKENIVRRYDPKTYLQLAYNYQKIPVYTRTVFTTSFGYHWRTGRYRSHQFYPVQINLVKLPFIDPDFAMRIDTSSYLSYSYKDVLIPGGVYTYTFSNQQISRARSHQFLKMHFEVSGNLMQTVSLISGREQSEEGYTILGQQYAQFVKTDIDYRYNYLINEASSSVFRLFAGIGVPFGNSRALPFEKQYFGGGANGVRAWQVRSLGPGSFNNYIPSFINQTAEVKIELNSEYRFKLFWILEGAVFLDAGNIWTIKEDADRPGSVFRFGKFIDDMAVGTGAGMRFDLNFVLLRTDLGIKLRDPAISEGSKWIRAGRPYNFREDFTFMIGIGYPF